MMNHATTELFFDDMEIPASSLVGEEGKGFRYILSGMNAERLLIAAECIGDAKWFIEKASVYAGDRTVFQTRLLQRGIPSPESEQKEYDQRIIELMALYDAGGKHLIVVGTDEPVYTNMLPGFVQTHGGFGFAEEYDIERKFREARLYQVAPISTNLVLSYVAEHVLGLPRSY